MFSCTVVILALTSVTCVLSISLQCRVVSRPVHRILATIAVKKSAFGNFVFKSQSYEVTVDTASSQFWLINKDYTLWQYDHPESVNLQTSFYWESNCDLHSPTHFQIVPPNFTAIPPKYVPDPANDMTIYGEPCPSNHLSFANYWLTIIWNVNNERVVIGQTDMHIPLGGVWKVILKESVGRFSEGVLGLFPTFENETNQPNFLFNAKQYLRLPMFALYLGVDDDNCHLSLGEPMDGIRRSKLSTVSALNDEDHQESWTIQPTVGYEMWFCNGGQQQHRTLISGNTLPPVMLDSGNPVIYLPSAMMKEWYQNLGINSDVEANIPDTCKFWEDTNPTLDILIDSTSYIRLLFVNLIQRDVNDPTLCICVIRQNDENITEVGSRLLKTYYVEFYFESEQTRKIRYALMNELKV